MLQLSGTGREPSARQGCLTAQPPQPQRKGPCPTLPPALNAGPHPPRSAFMCSHSEILPVSSECRGQAGRSARERNSGAGSREAVTPLALDGHASGATPAEFCPSNCSVCNPPPSRCGVTTSSPGREHAAGTHPLKSWDCGEACRRPLTFPGPARRSHTRSVFLFSSRVPRAHRGKGFVPGPRWWLATRNVRA